MKSQHLSIAILLFGSVASYSQMPEKLPNAVNNAEVSEILPVISADGKTLYFTRPRKNADGEDVLDIWYSDIDSHGRFKPAQVLGGKLSSRFGVAVTSISPDNNTLYIIGKFQKNTPPDERVYESHRTTNGWSQPTTIRIQNLNVRGANTDYSFGPDQKTLIMALNRDSSLGEADLYVSFLDEARHEWTTPLWLGANVNSSSFEMTPTLASDNRTLYFSSTRAGGYGAVDVYKTIRLDESWTKWSKPENLGEGINRKGRTTYYTEAANGKMAYFAWREDSYSTLDIYRFAITKRSALALLVTGTVKDESGNPLEAGIRYERLSDGKQLGFARTDPANGAYQIALPPGDKYGIRAELNGYISVSENITVTEKNLEESRNLDLVLVKIKENVPIRLNNIFFELDKATLLPESFAELNRLKKILDDDRTLHISIDGHTDSTGSAEHNKQLSTARAESVKSYLVSKGIDAPRLSANGFGSERPIAPNATEEDRAKNRRVEFRIQKQM